MTAPHQARLASAWPALREILLRFSFADMKTLTASAGLPIMKLSHLRQTSGGGRSTGKGELADAIDGLFNDLDPRRRIASQRTSSLTFSGGRATTMSAS